MRRRTLSRASSIRFCYATTRPATTYPILATAVPSSDNGGISPDGKTIVVHLRKDARWADGSALTAADWLFTYRAVLNSHNNVKSRYGWDGVAGASSPDAHTVVLHLKRPSASVLGILAIGTGYPPLPSHALAGLPDLNRAAINDAPISSGPFVLRAWNRGTSLEFGPNPRYFRGTPHLQRLTYAIVPDVNTLLNDVRTHDIDVYPDVDANSVEKLAGIDGIVVKHQLLANWHHLGLNVARPNLRDLRVRQAISFAVDWARIERTVYHGLDRLAVSDIFPQLWAAPALPAYAYDPSRAARLLETAGWHAGGGYRENARRTSAHAHHFSHRRTSGKRRSRSDDPIDACAVRLRHTRAQLSGQPVLRPERATLYRQVRYGMVDRYERPGSR